MRVTFDQCDSTDEVCGLFNKVFANIEQMEAKIVQNAQEIEALKTKKKTKKKEKITKPISAGTMVTKVIKNAEKKKGSKMKSKGSASMRVIAILMLIVAVAGLSYAAYIPTDINYEIASNPELLATYLRDVTGTMISDSYLFTPTLAADAPPLADGRVWYNNTANILQISLNGTTWTNIALAGGNSLDAAYDVAEEITVDSGTPVTFTVPDGGNNVGLLITNNDVTNDPDALVIDHNSDLATTTGIQIDSVAGDDIRGTGDVWDISRTGVISVTGMIVTTNDIVMENLDGINNVDDDIIEFWTDDKEDFEFNLATADTLTLASDTGIVTIAFGACDNLSGVETIVFDDAAASITQTGTGTNDLTITQAGATTQSLILNSDGTDDDALDINATAGGIDIDAAKSIVITSVENTTDSIVIQATTGGIDILADAAGATEDIDIASATGTVHIVGGEAATDSVDIDATGANGGIDLDTTDGPITLTTAGAANGDMTLTVADAFTLTSTDTAQNGIHIEANGGTAESINLYSNQGTGASATTQHDASIQLQSDAGGISLYTTGNVADAIRIETNGGVDEFITINNLQGTGTDAITITANAAGGDVDINSILGSIFIEAEEDSATAISIIADGVAANGGIWIQNETGTGVTEDAVAIEIRATLGGIAIQSDADLDDCIVIRADGGTASEMTITNDQGDQADAIEIVAAAGGITLNGAVGGVVFTAGQTRTDIPVVVVDGTVPPATTAIGTSGQSQIPVYSFDANPDATGDDYVFLLWRVPAGYVVDSADLFFTFSYSTAETDGDDVAFDCTVLAITPGSGAAGGTAFDAAGAAVAALDVDLVNGDGDEGKVMEGTFDIEVTAIAVGDEVVIAFWVDEDQCDLAVSGTVDIHNWTITYESTE